MIDQHSAIGKSKRQPSFAVGSHSAPRYFRLQLLLICVGSGLLSVAFGPDNYWDLRYYHLYAPWAYLHDRYLYDIGPAQEQGFFNPAADFLLYGMITSPLNEAPRIVAFIMGAMHGINAALILAIACQVVRSPDPLVRWTLRTAAWLMGISGSGFISLLGTCSNDLTSALFVLGSLLAVLKVAEHGSGRRPWRGFAAAGLLAGMGLGLKYTSAVFMPGLGVVTVLAALRRRTPSGLIVFGMAAGLGFLVIAGPHMLTLWNAFMNPFFPFLNQIFQSPYFEPTALRDARFLPHNLWELVTFPFSWTKISTYVVAELPFRDWRAAIAYIAMIFGVSALAAYRLRKDHFQDKEFAETSGLALVFTFVVVSYFAWALGFGYYRYAIPLEMLTGVVSMGALIYLFGDYRLRIVSAVAVLTVAITTTVYLDWGHRQYGDKYVDVQVPPLPTRSIVLIATWDPVAYFIPFAEPTAQYVGIENNYLELSQTNKLALEVKRLMRAPGRSKFVLSVGEFDSTKLNQLLANFDLKLSALPCQPIHSNLEVQTLSLCSVSDGAAGRNFLGKET
jgi:hypothetical protein